MDLLSNLKFAEGSRKNRKRVGRGVGSGHGKTSCRGHNGQRSRSGSKSPAWFKGGQMPLQRRIPKFGFTNHNHSEYQVLNLGNLQDILTNKKISFQNLSPEVLYNEGILSKKSTPLKILGTGELKDKIEISAHQFSKSAKEKIEKIGGKATLI